MAFAPVFYPGTTRASQARLVTLGAGEERSAIDVEIEYVPVARIAGTVIGPAGGSAPAYVRLVPDSQEALAGQAGFRGITTSADGAFEFDHVPPGRYIVAARASSDGSMALRYDAATALWASTEIVVDGQDIPNLVLSPVPGITLEGRLVFQRTTAAAEIVRAARPGPAVDVAHGARQPDGAGGRGRPIQRLRHAAGNLLA